MHVLIEFVKKWTLPVSMVAGTLGYVVFHKVEFLAPAKPFVWEAVKIVTPLLIFIQLFLTFCKVRMDSLRLTRWHIVLIVFQILSSAAVASVLVFVPMDEIYREIFEGAMVCLICPTATAAAVITDKMGGSAARITIYTLISNLVTAIFVPVVFPLVEVHSEMGFAAAFFRILSKVFPLLICPFLLALLLKYLLPKVHDFFRDRSHWAFYIWAIALALVTGQTVRSLHVSTAPSLIIWSVAGVSVLCCAVQFFLGKKVGGRYGDRITAGQALGQKNTVFAIWMAYTYLNPLSSLAPGTYVLWQNIFNGWQLWRLEKKRASEKS